MHNVPSIAVPWHVKCLLLT